jgi:membrane protein DedA with SNARE-associated domain
MIEIIELMRELIEDIILLLGYPGILLALFGETVFPPTPSETIMLFSGMMAGQGHLTYGGVVLAATAGALSGSLLVYYLGRRIDERLIEEGINRYGRYLFLSLADYQRARDVFQRRGLWIILFSRVLPVIRAFVPLVAGIQRMPLRRFLPTLTLGTTIYNAVYIWLGTKLGENWQTVLGLLDVYEDVLWVAITGTALAFIFMKIIRPRLLLREPIKDADTTA